MSGNLHRLKSVTLTIWQYSDDPHEIQPSWIAPSACIFCKIAMRIKTVELWNEEYRQVLTCPSCGWWSIRGVAYTYPGRGGRPSNHWRRDLDISGAVGALKRLDLTDIALPASEVRNFLRARFEARSSVHPKLFEETVASVFKSLGFDARATAYSGDGGIDIVLDGPGDSTVGVQVKRWKNTIQVDQIREFLGALVLEGHTSGIFVTTSAYSRGAIESASVAETRGIPIKLLNASDFYKMLGIAQVSEPTVPDVDEYLERCEFVRMHEIEVRRDHPRVNEFYSDLIASLLKSPQELLSRNLVVEIARKNRICPDHELWVGRVDDAETT